MDRGFRELGARRRRSIAAALALAFVGPLAFGGAVWGKGSEPAPDRPGRGGPPALEDAGPRTIVPGDRRPATALKRARRSSEQGLQFVPGELIVKYRPGVDRSQRHTLRSAVDSEGRDSLLLPRAELVELEPGSSVRQAVDELDSSPEVAYALPNYIQQLQALPNDTFFGDMWGLRNSGQAVNGDPGGTPGADINAPAAWDTTTGSEQVVVGIIDSGVQYRHPDIAANLFTNPGEAGAKATNGVDDDGNGLVDDVNGWDFKVDDNDPMDMQGHGTHVAGTVGAQGNNGYGATGVSWEASLLPMKIGGVGTGTSVAAALEAIVYAGKTADIANGSFGGPSVPELERAYDDAINQSPGTLFVFAAGNASQDIDANSNYPCNANAPNVVCVGATDQNDQFAEFSNYGPQNVDLAAPGVSVLSTYPEFYDAFNEGFDGGANGWATGSVDPATFAPNGYDDWGVVHPGDPPNAIFHSSTSGRYIPNNITFAQLEGIDVSGHSNCGIDFETLFHIEPPDQDGSFFDSLRVFLAADGGADNYEKLFELASSSGEEFQQGSLEYLNLQMELDELAKQGGPNLVGSKNIGIEFDLASDEAVEGIGALFDNIRFFCTRASSDAVHYLPGTSMAAPHVAGAAALMKAQRPNATPQQLRAALLASVDVLPSLQGRVGTSGRLNADSALDAIGGGAPPPGGGPGPGAGEDCAKATKKLKRAKKKVAKFKTKKKKAKKKARKSSGKKAKRFKKKAKRFKKKLKRAKRKKRKAQKQKILNC